MWVTGFGAPKLLGDLDSLSWDRYRDYVGGYISMWWQSILFTGCVVVSLAFVLLESLQSKEGHDRETKRKRKEFHKGMTESEYVSLIPKEELRRVRKLIKQVVDARGGWATSDLTQLDEAWRRVLDAAKTPTGGAWSGAFEPEELREDRLQRLSSAIDRVLLGGMLRKAILMRRSKQPSESRGADGSSNRSDLVVGDGDVPLRGLLRFVVDRDDQGESDWISYFDVGNIIHLLESKWRQDVHEGKPMCCEGVLCNSRLQVLAHTIAHETVHALVSNMFPDIDQSSEAYLPDQRHGPIFKLLNKRLFGHSSDSYRHIFPY